MSETTTLTENETVGERIKRMRVARGLSQRDMEGPGVTYAYISRIENNERRASEKALRHIARMLSVTPHELESGSKGGICPHCLQPVNA